MSKKSTIGNALKVKPQKEGIKLNLTDEDRQKLGLEKVLSVSLRPKTFDKFIGLDDIINNLQTQFNSGRIPHFFIITGNTGCGKTSISRIIANKLEGVLSEINASDKNGIDDIRLFLENANYLPHPPYKSRVYIFDEFHQMTTAAQNCLLKICEEPPDHVFIICCTSNSSKILPTLKRRAYIIDMHGIDKESIGKLINFAKEKAHFEGETKELEDALVEHEINSPGIILQICEKFFNGTDVTECIYGSSNEGIDTKRLCNTLSKGDWKNASPILKTMTKEDVVMVRSMIIGYFKAILLNSGSVKIAQAMKIIGEEVYDLPTFLANLAIACNTLKTA